MDVVQVTHFGNGILATTKINKVVNGRGVLRIQNVGTDFPHLDVAYVAQIVLMVHLIRVLCVVEILFHIQLEQM